MGTKHIPRHSFNEAEGFKVFYSTPKRGFATVRFRTNVSGSRINISVVCPEPEKAKDSLDLSTREFEDILQAAANLVKVLLEHAFGKDTII